MPEKFTYRTCWSRYPLITSETAETALRYAQTYRPDLTMQEMQVYVDGKYASVVYTVESKGGVLVDFTNAWNLNRFRL